MLRRSPWRWRARPPGASRRSLGRLLVEDGLLRREELESTVRLQLERAVGQVLKWDRGSFDFALDEIRPIDEIGTESFDYDPGDRTRHQRRAARSGTDLRRARPARSPEDAQRSLGRRLRRPDRRRGRSFRRAGAAGALSGSRVHPATALGARQRSDSPPGDAGEGLRSSGRERERHPAPRRSRRRARCRAPGSSPRVAAGRTAGGAGRLERRHAGRLSPRRGRRGAGRARNGPGLSGESSRDTGDAERLEREPDRAGTAPAAPCLRGLEVGPRERHGGAQSHAAGVGILRTSGDLPDQARPPRAARRLRLREQRGAAGQCRPAARRSRRAGFCSRR